MNPLQKLRLMVARGIVNLVNDAGGLQMLQISALDGETRDEVERVQNFGHTGNPPMAATPIMVAVAGSRDHLVAVAVDHEDSRPKGLQPGESATYNAFGVLFKYDQDGNATLTCKNLIVDASEGIQFNTPLTNFSEMATVNGLFSYKAGMSGSGGDGGKTTISGDFTHSGGDLSSNGVVVHLHYHGHVTRGSENTDSPT
ncbi:phage baseplate assembly protein V [Paludibacterium denitrificans]|uniref:Phage baseplate assembly protein V n=1 Tax=Paludibacterium denitrificans TaxID=2675226 RepID=A0A844GB04_9NEIS|nr:phage baseplate assembly protein V [Paludibacterium denitrificans]MTD32418.1 phage baseplate assembly protein V [Paludibacterium denitrificans]